MQKLTIFRGFIVTFGTKNGLFKPFFSYFCLWYMERKKNTLTNKKKG